MSRLQAALLCGFLLTVGGTARADVVTEWNSATLEAIRKDSSPPPIAAKSLAMVHIAMYDTAMAFRGTHYPFLASRTAPTGANLEAALTQAAYRVLIDLFPQQRADFDQRWRLSLQNVPQNAARDTSLQLGNDIAEAILKWRENDGSQKKVKFMGSREVGKWRPTPPDYLPALLPQWGDVETFGIDDASEYQPPGPPPLTSAEYTEDWKEVKDLGGKESTTRTADQTHIAQFWVGNPGTVTPPGQWNHIAQTISRNRNLSLEENARLFAMLNAALADAAICCWKTKYMCNFWRPVTAIREADTDNNPATEREPNWSSLIITPPFPSCTSGHSTFSGAASAMMAEFLGTDAVSFTAQSEDVGGTRSFTSLSQAAEEAGRSRIYGGIHYQFENEQALAIGRRISRDIARRHFRPASEEETTRWRAARPQINGAQASGTTAYSPAETGQRVTHYPSEATTTYAPGQATTAYSPSAAPTVTYYPSQSVTSYYAPAAVVSRPVAAYRPVTSYYPSAVTSFYRPRISYYGAYRATPQAVYRRRAVFYAPRTTYYAPATTYYTPSTVCVGP